MILLDANLLIYSHVASFRQHVPAKTWLDAQLGAGGRVGMPWVSLVAFVRIVTNPRIFERPEPLTDAWKQVEDWLEIETVWVPQPTDTHRAVLGSLLTAGAARANLVPDAHLAAIAIGHGLLLCSADGNFARFPGLRWENPLRSA